MDETRQATQDEDLQTCHRELSGMDAQASGKKEEEPDGVRREKDGCAHGVREEDMPPAVPLATAFRKLFRPTLPRRPLPASLAAPPVVWSIT